MREDLGVFCIEMGSFWLPFDHTSTRQELQHEILVESQDYYSGEYICVILLNCLMISINLMGDWSQIYIDSLNIALRTSKT